MAKKKKKYLIKLNNKIRNHFDGQPFDEGVSTLETPILQELIMLVPSLNQNQYFVRDDMIRALRRVWSQEGANVRDIIVSYLTQKKSIENRNNSNEVIDKILYFLEEEKYSKSEEKAIIKQFENTKRHKITKEKVISSLNYLRLKERALKIEQELNISFGSYGISFYSSFKIFDFSKQLLITIPFNEKNIQDSSLTKKISLLKEKAIEKKQNSINEFIENLDNNKNSYLNSNEIYEAVKKMSPQDEFYHIPIKLDIVQNILNRYYKETFVTDSLEHIIVEKEEEYNLFGTILKYTTSISYEKHFLFHIIWNNSPLPFEDDLVNLNENLIEHFEQGIKDILEDMKSESQKLEIDDETYHLFILQFVEPMVSGSRSLKIKEKTKRRVIFDFLEYIKPLLEKQKREELLANTIRDFKRLFPLARALNRKIYFHTGPTNSGKTYSALEKLKKASTGYYLAPLRLLALEGYEGLKKDNIDISLITGEEEIINEDSTHISSTIEMMNSSVEVDVCVIDEIQMINDRDRGWAWANALIGVPAKEIILTGSKDALLVVEALCEYLEEPLEVIEFERKNRLQLLSYSTPLKRVEPKTAIVAFSRKEVLSIKQQLSKEHKVSVVYGNLSPEVRREEAKRFREGKSDILVATDAIAMGLNLPIKTILFAKDNKFDGLRRRELLPTEVTQIAGRAGRYGIEEEGFVGAIDTNILETIEKAFYTPLPNISLPISVMASLEHILLIGEILETQNILEILTFFSDNMEFEGPFVAANIDSMLEIASIVSEYELDLKTRFFLSCAPASISSPYIESIFHRYIKRLEEDKIVDYFPPKDLPDFAKTNDMLLNAEDRVREISLYLWLSFKFPEHFKDTQKAKEARVKLNNYIENSLRRGNFTKECKKCGKALDLSYRFSICDSCHTDQKRGLFAKREKSRERGRNKKKRW